ncbi:MAG: ADP-glyceromanno-heptose 6-epimerase [Chlorobi bacterium]|nr:ADP-glyceromanno-heptose 6-epimerase [Chlorobiota bacterium]MCI0717163.1 ADP-glyceromanno-heptose 6-epimerase [Chlorobiota bacterium]
MKIITGGAGFIGSAICWRLNTLGINDILIVDTDMEGTKKQNVDSLEYADFIDKDTFLKQIIKGAINYKVDSIYHMGACSSTTEDDMEFLKENNVEYSKHLAGWCLKNDVKYIYASSGATYGAGEQAFDDDVELFPRLKPLNKYGLSKHMFDLWVVENNLHEKFVGLKYFNVFGPNENHKGDMRSMVNKAYGQIMQNGKLKLFKSLKRDYKDGEQKRDFIYVKDAVDMTLYFDPLTAAGKDLTGIYNIGSGTASTWLELAGAIFTALDKVPMIEFIDMPENIKNQYQYYSKANISKLREAGYSKSCMNLKDSVKDYVQNYLMKDKYLTV